MPFESASTFGKIVIDQNSCFSFVSQTCKIGGVTHTDREDKTSVSFMMQVPEAGQLQLDVNAYAGYVNASGNYYYDQVVIMVEAAAAPETSAPTSGAPILVTTILVVASAVMGWVVMS